MGKSIYQVKLEKKLEEFKRLNLRPRLLLHSCCGPCSSYVLSYLKDYFEITVFYYNPNIYPEEEYLHRLSEQSRLIDEMNKEAGKEEVALIPGKWDEELFLEMVKGLEGEPEGGARCAKCFEMRLGETKKLAEEGNFDYFATTLTVSPHKNAVLINSIGEGVGGNWLPSDFKKREGYKKSIELSKKYGLYRQDYCGCRFSIHQEE
mgnify:CR=1 FL=1